jgi:hypothetical protein
MKKYNVGFWYTVYGSMKMEADSPEEAEEKVEETLSSNGLDELDYRENDRDYGAQDAELVEETSFEKFSKKGK